MREHRCQNTGTGAGEHDQSLVTHLERAKVEPWIEAIVSAKMSFGKEPAKIGVARGILREQCDMRAVEQRNFGAGNRLDTDV